MVNRHFMKKMAFEADSTYRPLEKAAAEEIASKRPAPKEAKAEIASKRAFFETWFARPAPKEAKVRKQTESRPRRSSASSSEWLPLPDCYSRMPSHTTPHQPEQKQHT